MKITTDTISPSLWVGSDDAIAVWASTNGHGRGDGYDVDVYRSRRTGRHIVRAYDVAARRSSWYVADTEAAARAVGAHGYSPGSAPGAYRYISRWRSMAEARAPQVAA